MTIILLLQHQLTSLKRLHTVFLQFRYRYTIAVWPTSALPVIKFGELVYYHQLGSMYSSSEEYFYIIALASQLSFTSPASFPDSAPFSWGVVRLEKFKTKLK